MAKLETKINQLTLNFDTDTLTPDIQYAGIRWQFEENPYLLMQDEKKLYFNDADKIEHQPFISGIGQGVHSTYEFSNLSFETIIWVENATSDVYFEFIPIQEEKMAIKAVYWPTAIQFDKPQSNWYTVFNQMQGVLLPNTWENEVSKLHFDGQLCSSAAYMPWFGQIKENNGYLAIAIQPWDSAYQIDHPANGPYTHISMRQLPSLGKIGYRRTIRYSFMNHCDYNDLCKKYRQYAKENGKLVTLKEKAARNPLVDKLIGSAFVHKGIKTHVSKGSLFYNEEHPEKNESLVTFKKRCEEIIQYHEKGIEKLYLHLDGWAEPGYDNKHPDYLPACIDAGGWNGMKELSDTLQKFNYMFGLHDQYRDYYFDAPTFDKNFACHDPLGNILDVARWAGGRQSYLCASQAPYYVKRNFEEILSHGIHLEASYLDVFTCNEGDECDHKWHRMNRRECFEYREACFNYLLSKNILPSSEECNDWAMRSLVFAHYGPYDFMLARPDAKRNGIPVPLFNLVYHDCIILPWPMEHDSEREDYMLYALLNGGAAYLDKDGAYPNVDGVFDEDLRVKQLDEEIKRYQTVAKLQNKVAYLEMTHHEFVDGNPLIQRSTFADGTCVTINLHNNEFEIN